MEASNESKIKDYIQEKEKTEWFGWIIDIIGSLTWLEKETKDWIFSKWLKNDENLLEYAKLSNRVEELRFGENIKFKLLEVKLSVTCPYFADFKAFIRALNQRVSNPTSEVTSESAEISNHTFCWTSVDKIKSEPFEKSSETWVTRCSRTARCNWRNFGISLPSWNAYDAWKFPWQDSLQTIPKDKINKRPESTWKWIEITAFKSVTEWNYADIYTDASATKYGHRAAVFRDDRWQRYVLDPYTRVNWRLDNSPKKLEDYLKVKKIVKAHFYNSTWYTENHSNVHKDQWTWYERSNR